MPGRIENTVFISYRRTNLPWALAIYHALTQYGYDVFFDYESIKSGDFEQVIFQNIKARAHFVVILTPSALERCKEPGDWLRREIETAIDEKRNIVPLFLEGFSFSSPAIAQGMTGKLELLKKYNGMNVPADYFDEAMERLREERLNVSLEAVLHPLSSTVQKAVEVQQTAANNATQIKQKELSAQEWFEQGYKHLQEGNYDAAIQSNSAAIALKPDLALAYVNRAAARVDKGEIEEGILDCNRAIELDPQNVRALCGRAMLMATCPDDRFRHGEAAVEDAGRACELTGWTDLAALDAMAAAAAEYGDFEAATASANKVLGADVKGTREEKQRVRARLKLYKAGKPLRMEAGRGA